MKEEGRMGIVVREGFTSVSLFAERSRLPGILAEPTSMHCTEPR